MGHFHLLLRKIRPRGLSPRTPPTGCCELIISSFYPAHARARLALRSLLGRFTHLTRVRLALRSLLGRWGVVLAQGPWDLSYAARAQ